LAAAARIAAARVGLVAMASIVTSAPLSPPWVASRSISTGMAVVSFDFASTASCPTPRAAVGDKGYAGGGNRTAARERGIAPVIPYKSNEKNRPAFFPKALYRARARIEQTVGKLKRFKRIALRCEKTARNFSSIVAFALGLIIVKTVHRAYQDVLRARRAEFRGHMQV
jgi:hypothetical protein